MNDLTKNVLVFIVIIVVLLSVVQGLSGVNPSSPNEQDYSQFLSALDSGQISVAEIDKENDIIRYGTTNEQPQYFARIPETDYSALIGDLQRNGVQFSAT